MTRLPEDFSAVKLVLAVSLAGLAPSASLMASETERMASSTAAPAECMALSTAVPADWKTSSTEKVTSLWPVFSGMRCLSAFLPRLR